MGTIIVVIAWFCGLGVGIGIGIDHVKSRNSINSSEIDATNSSK